MIISHPVSRRGIHRNCEWNFKLRVSRFLWGLLIVLSACRTVSGRLKTSPPSSLLDSLVSDYELIRLNVIAPLQSKISKPFGKEPEAIRSSTIPIHMQVHALGRKFEISLRQGQSVFTDNATVVLHDDSGSEVYPASDFHTGTVEGYVAYDPSSIVHGHLVDGLFEGVIRTRADTYYVEPARKFFGDDVLVQDAIVYRLRDVLPLPTNRYRGGRESDVWMPEKSRNNRIVSYASDSSRLSNVIGESSRLSEWLGGESQKTGKVCKFHVVADHFFYQRIGRSTPRIVMGKLEFHMQEADRIFRLTDFDNNEKPDDLRIRIQRVDMFKNAVDPGYKLGNPKLNASSYLQLFSEYDHDNFCGAMAFSFRVFEDSVLGLAYRGSPTNVGGVCYKRRDFEGKSLSMNVAMVSLDSAWGALLQAQSLVVVVHEMGHMFGSPHDDDMEGGICFNAKDVKQHFLMSAMANPGTSPNNQRFSPCSRRAIQINLLANGGCMICTGRDCGAGVRCSPAVALVLLPLLLALLQLFGATPMWGS